MSKEIKIGEYIRTKKGNIGKVLDITTCTGQKRKKYLIKWNIVKAYYITDITIIKHSPNIIDLIEKGDYVNGVEVIWVNKYGIVHCNSEDTIDYNVKEIETIVTKEQFKRMEYRV